MILADIDQSTIILQVFALDPDGSEKLDVTGGTVRVYRVNGAVETDVLPMTALAQVGTTNVWRHEWTPGALPVNQYVAEFILTDGDRTTKVGEDLIVRDVARQATLTLIQSDIALIKHVETGRWKIDNNQMTFYDVDGVTPLLVFNLYDDAHLPSEERVFERDPA